MAAQDEQHLYSLPLENIPDFSNYNDLLNKPKINNVTLQGDLSLNELGINIPTKVSDLTNDLHFATESQIPTQTSQLTNSGFTTQSYVDGKIAQLNIPTKTSELTNDSHFATESQLPTKTSELTNDSDFTTKSYVDGEIDAIETVLSNLNGITIVKSFLQERTFTSTFDNLATSITTALTALKTSLGTSQFAEIKALRINTIGNVKPTKTIVIDSNTDLLSLVIDWQGFTYYNNAVEAIDVVGKKVLHLTMTNDTNDDAYVSYFSDVTEYTFTIEYSVYKTISLS